MRLPPFNEAAPFEVQKVREHRAAGRGTSGADRARDRRWRRCLGSAAAARPTSLRICRSRCIRWPIRWRTYCRGIGHRRPMRGIIDAVVALPKLVEARHVGRHVAVGRNDDGRRPAHHMVASEQCVAISEAKVVGRVARRRNRNDRLAVDLDTLAVREHLVGRIIAVERSVGARADRFQRERRAAYDRRAGPLGQRPAAGLWSRWVWVHRIAATGPPGDRLISASRCSGRSGPGSTIAT